MKVITDYIIPFRKVGELIIEHLVWIAIIPVGFLVVKTCIKIAF